MWNVRKEESCLQILVDRSEGNRLIGRSRRRWEFRTEIYLPETGYGDNFVSDSYKV
jgi:hypothetical protein